MHNFGRLSCGSRNAKTKTTCTNLFGFSADVVMPTQKHVPGESGTNLKVLKVSQDTPKCLKS